MTTTPDPTQCTTSTTNGDAPVDQCDPPPTTAPTTTSPEQCYDETGRAIDAGKRCVDTPVEPGAPVTICEDGTPCPTVTATVATVTTAATVVDPQLPTTGLGLDGALLATVLLAAGLAARITARRPA